jgi:ubiquinone/menaquinone biosynthesis C-methylase UbiE
VLTDVPRAALQDAAAGAYRQGLRHTTSFLLANGAQLPFRPQSFDAVVHTDVL